MSIANSFVTSTLLAVGAALAGADSASAQDWTGGFVSIGLGQGSSTVDWTMPSGAPIFAPPGYRGAGSDSGLAANVEVGQLYGSDALLYGWAFGLTHLSHDQSMASPLFPLDTFATEMGPVISLTGRIGRASGRWMVYGEAGAVAARLGTPHSTPFCPSPCTLDLDTVAPGAVLGVGVDYRLNERFSLGLNYRHMRFFDTNASGMVSGLAAPQTYELGGDANVVTLRVTMTLD